MFNTINNTNSVQQFSAVNAFKSNKTLKPQENEQNLVDNTSSGTASAPKSILDRVDVADIRKNATYVGEFNITDDDIKYGLMYGRSVIAEYLC